MMQPNSTRLVVIGRNSKVWRTISDRLPGAVAIGHRDVVHFSFRPDDVVWIFSYSRNDADNEALFECLANSAAEQFIYVSTASANIADKVRCYAYPRAKRRAEGRAVAILRAHVIRLGLVYDRVAELPSGLQAQTSVGSIVAAMEGSLAGGPAVVEPRLFELDDRPFASRVERLAYIAYGVMVSRLPLPCAARPVDAVLRSLGWRWYGYVYLSNRLWKTTTL